MIDTGSFSILYLEEDRKFVVSTQRMFMERMRFKRMKKLIDGKNDSEVITMKVIFPFIICSMIIPSCIFIYYL